MSQQTHCGAVSYLLCCCSLFVVAFPRVPNGKPKTPPHQFSFLCTCTNVDVGYWNLWLCNSYSDSEMDVLLSCCRLENSLSPAQIKREELSDLNFQIQLSIEERKITHLPVCSWGIHANSAKGTSCTAFGVSVLCGTEKVLTPYGAAHIVTVSFLRPQLWFVE